jgi:hypothetical protein
VVYFLSRGNPTLLLTTLTERMLCYVSISDALPCPIVPFPHSRVAIIAFVSPGFLLGMFITEPTIRQFRTAGKGARPFWFSWHLATSFTGIKKALTGSSHEGLSITFHNTIIFGFLLNFIS